VRFAAAIEQVQTVLGVHQDVVARCKASMKRLLAWL
jgi:hypothetical protein